MITLTQQMYILNEETMTIAYKVDILDKHIYHTDYFSESLASLINESTIVADYFLNSVKVIKGKIFVMGINGFYVGTISNWADRILDTIETGDYVAAIELATDYYLGTNDLVIVGLPENDKERHKIVSKNLPGMITASVTYTFNGKPDDVRASEGGIDEWTRLLTELCETVIRAWVATDQSEDLIEDIFEEFESHDYLLLFFDILSGFILSGQVNYLPPRVFKELVKTYISDRALQERLEELICSLDVQSLDLDLAISLCSEYRLQDTLMYIWNHALHDFITPLWDLCEIIKEGPKDIKQESEALKVFPYISYILTGRIYPTGVPFSDSSSAKSYIYYFLFNSSNINWPSGSETVLKTVPYEEDEPAYPYLVLLIKFGVSEFFSALNEAFEDSFLNETESKTNKSTSSNEAIVFGSTVTRQLIINILLDLFNSTPEISDKRIFLDIFISRNYPKYSQFIILPGNVLAKVLEEVCLCQDPELKKECQLGVEALLTKYKPFDLDDVVKLLHEVKYYHVLQYIYRSEKRYSKLLETAFKEIDESKIISIVAECFKNTKDATGLQEKERSVINSIVIEKFQYLLTIDCNRMVNIISIYSPQLHENVFKLDDVPDLQYQYLKSLFDLVIAKSGSYPLPTMRYRHLYLRLLAKRKLNSEIYLLLSTLITGNYDIDLNVLRDDLQESGAVDSIILMLLRQKKYSEAVDCVVERLYSRVDVPKYLDIGVEICTKSDVKTLKPTAADSSLGTLSEQLWVTLIDALVDISKQPSHEEGGEEKTRHLLQKTLSHLLDNTSNNATIVRICSSLMTPLDISQPRTIGSVRPILTDLFSAYKYQETVLSIVKQLLDKDSYDSLQLLVANRLQGWRVSKTGECEGCGKKILGLGVDADVLYDDWLKLSHNRSKKLTVKGLLKGKGVEKKDVVVSFKCNHCYHLGCLRNLGVKDELECILCEKR